MTTNSDLLRLRVFQAYSRDIPSCSCCGEATMAFLTLDYLTGGNPIPAGTASFLHQIAQAGFPKDLNLGVVCWNCSVGRRVNGGQCPHVKQRYLARSGRRHKKLTKDEVAFIRAQAGARGRRRKGDSRLSLKELAQRFQLSPAAINTIQRER